MHELPVEGGLGASNFSVAAVICDVDRALKAVNHGGPYTELLTLPTVTRAMHTHRFYVAPTATRATKGHASHGHSVRYL